MLLLDILLTIVHLSIVFFNLFGWIPRRTRRAHFISLTLTAASWFILGIWYGVGYCPFTEWQWKVKEGLGEKNLPNNFIEYILEKITDHNFSSAFVGTLITICFITAVLLSLFVNFILPRLKKQGKRNNVNSVSYLSSDPKE